jgi:trehalose 6-phosphate synthase
LSRFRGTFHSFDPVGFAIFAIPQAASVGRKSGLLVNPYDPEAVATSIAHALSMSLEERRTRHQALFQVISDNDLKSWGEHFLVALTNDAASPLRHEQLGVTPPLRSNVA